MINGQCRPTIWRRAPRTLQFIHSDLLPLISAALEDPVNCYEGDAPFVITVRYPAGFPDNYLRPELRLEVGPLASWVPHEERRITCYAAEAFPNVFETRERSVNVIKAERTFWEKATILHAEAHRPDHLIQPSRYSRHYYDLLKMARSSVKDSALKDLDLLADVVAFKKRFYPSGWAQYDLAKPGTLRLIPDGHVLEAVAGDYKAMGELIFGTVPSLEEIMSVLRELEKEING